MRCNYGSDLDSYGYQLLTCKFGGGPSWQHNSVEGPWGNCMNKLHIPHQVEPRNRYFKSNDRPDIVTFDPSNGSSVELDVSVAHPFSKETVKRNAEESGYVAVKQDQKKILKYEKDVFVTEQTVTCTTSI